MVKGLDIVKKIEQVGTMDGKPAGPVKVVDCGEVSESKIQDGKGTGIFLFKCVFVGDTGIS